MEQKQIDELVNNYLLIEMHIKALERQKDLLKEQIVALGEGDHRTNSGKVTVTLSQRSLLDQKALKEAYGDALAPYYKTTASITVRTTVF